MDLAVNPGRDFAGFDFAAAAPEYGGVADGNALLRQVIIDRNFVFHDTVLLAAVDDRHDVDVAKARAAFAPITMGQNVMAPDLAAGAVFHAFRNRPVEEAIETCHADAGL